MHDNKVSVFTSITLYILSFVHSHIDRLDDALIRPGRIDVRVHFGHATRRQAHELFSKFYPSLPQDSELPSKFAKKIPEDMFSMAHLQGFLMGYKQRPEEAVKLVDEWVETHQKDTIESKPLSSVQDY